MRHKQTACNILHKSLNYLFKADRYTYKSMKKWCKLNEKFIHAFLMELRAVVNTISTGHQRLRSPGPIFTVSVQHMAE